MHAQATEAVVGILVDGIVGGLQKRDLDAAVYPIVSRHTLSAGDTKAARLLAWTTALNRGAFRKQFPISSCHASWASNLLERAKSFGRK